MSVLTLPQSQATYHSLIDFEMHDRPIGLEQKLTLYVSSLLTDENVKRLKEFHTYVMSLPKTFNLQTAAYETQQILGKPLQDELRAGANTPTIMYYCGVNMLVISNPFKAYIVPDQYRDNRSPYGHKAFWRDHYEKSCFKKNLLINALYNLTYLLDSIDRLGDAWLLAQLLARINSNEYPCLDNASAALSTKLFNISISADNTMKYYPSVLQPKDPALLDTYNQITGYIQSQRNMFTSSALMLYLIMAADTEPYVSEVPQASVLVSSPGDNVLWQDKTEFLPTGCYAIIFRPMEFGIPALFAVSEHNTNVLLFPATPECYKFLCKLYSVKPYDGITPLQKYYKHLWETLFTPFLFSKIARVTYSKSTYSKGQMIFNKTASLTDYIPSLQHSDAPQYMVNEFEVPRS